MSYTHDERLANVQVHLARLQDILTIAPPKEASQRIYRTRAIIDNDYVVITLLQNLPNHVNPAGSPDIKIHIFVDRPYTATNAAPVAQMTLVGQYSLDEIVAFLALDKVDPTSLEWIDETKYSHLVVVGDILRKLR
jgi:hypothetical protein